MHVSEPIRAHVSKYRPKFNCNSSFIAGHLMYRGRISLLNPAPIDSISICSQLALRGSMSLSPVHMCLRFDTAHVLHIHISWYTWNILNFFHLLHDMEIGFQIGFLISAPGPSAGAAGLFDWHYYVSEEHPTARTLFCFWQQIFLQWSPEWESEGSNLTRETSKNKGAILISFTGATRVVPPHNSVSWLAFLSS